MIISIFIGLQRTPLVSRGCEKVSLTTEKSCPCRVCAPGFQEEGLVSAQGRIWVPWGQQLQPLSNPHGDPEPSLGCPVTSSSSSAQPHKAQGKVWEVAMPRCPWNRPGMVPSIPSIPRP